MLHYLTLISCPYYSESVESQKLRAQGNSGGYMLGIWTSCVGVSSRTFIFLVLPEMPGSHLFLVNGQDIKTSKSRGATGARWIESCGQRALGKGNIHKTAITDLLSIPLYFVKPLLSDWKYFCRYGSVKLCISALDRWIWHKMYPKRNVLHHELAKRSWIHIGIWKLLPLPTKAMT